MNSKHKNLCFSIALLLCGNVPSAFASKQESIYHFVVAQDKSGDYTTVQEAIDHVPDQSKVPFRILIKDGYYNEHLEIPANKTNICLIGTDPLRVTIGEETHVSMPERIIQGKKIRSGTCVNIYADNFQAENITFENSWGMMHKAGPQALAMNSYADKLILKNCRLLSYQDTYLTSTRKHTDRHYLKNCYIEGAVDFIYGSGNVVFDSCTIGINRKSGGYIVAPNHSPVVPWGYVFLNCRIIPKQDSTDVWLGRPWHQTPKTVFINTVSEVTIRPMGWVDKMGGLPAIFAEYNTMDKHGKPLDLSQRRTSYWNWKDASKVEKVTAEAMNILKASDAACYTVGNVLSGNDAWQPDIRCAALENPVLRRTNSSLRWNHVQGAIGYLCFVNGQLVGITKKIRFSIKTAKTDTIRICAVNQTGGF